MKHIKNISKLLLKRWLKVLSTSEEEVLNKAIKEDACINKVQRKQVLKKLECFDAIDSESAFKNVLNKLEETPKTSTPKVIVLIRPYLKYVAMLILGVISFMLYQHINKTPDSLSKKLASLNVTIPYATLKWNDKIYSLNADKEQPIINSNGDTIAIQSYQKITYLKNNDIEVHSKEIHQLTVPKGRSFRVIFDDSTKVYCDAGSTLTYPATLSVGSTRKIALVGQAFFDVTKNKTRPFIVATRDMDIEVIGTQFNVLSFPENATTQTTLVEGAIKATTKHNNKTIAIVPGQKVDASKTKQNVVVKQVNTYDYTSWLSKKLVFKNESFATILKQLERKFGVIIINENVMLSKKSFTAKFSTETLEEILVSFQQNSNFDYYVKDNAIIIQ